MKGKFFGIALLAILAISASQVRIYGQEEKKSPLVKMSFELGYVGIYLHTIQFSSTGSNLNFITDGGQENLYPISKLSFEWKPAKRHSLIFLYQPLTIESQSILKKDLLVDGVTFSSNTPMTFKYGFDFYRMSYLYTLIDQPRFKWEIGLSVQIRNASIIFSSLDGTKSSENQGIGIVPILKTRALLNLSDLYYLETEIDGFYATGKVFNGTTDTDFTGSILDANLRFGWHLTPQVDSALVIRSLGGGAVGYESAASYDGLGDGYTENWLATISVALNLAYSF